MRGRELRFHLVAIISLVAKLIVTDQNRMPNGDKLSLDTHGLLGITQESSRIVSCFTFRTVTEDNFSFSYLLHFLFFKRQLFADIYLSLPFNSIMLRVGYLIIKYIFTIFQCYFYHNPDFSQKEVTWNTKVPRKYLLFCYLSSYFAELLWVLHS